MKRTVFKFNLSQNKTQSMPKNSKILSIGIQGESVMLWAEVDTNEISEDRNFMLVWTGESYNSEGTQFIGTVQRDWEVIHVFEIK